MGFRTLFPAELIFSSPIFGTTAPFAQQTSKPLKKFPSQPAYLLTAHSKTLQQQLASCPEEACKQEKNSAALKKPSSFKELEKPHLHNFLPRFSFFFRDLSSSRSSAVFFPAATAMRTLPSSRPDKVGTTISSGGVFLCPRRPLVH